MFDALLHLVGFFFMNNPEILRIFLKLKFHYHFHKDRLVFLKSEQNNIQSILVYPSFRNPFYYYSQTYV